MEFLEPQPIGYTIYTKSGCKYCQQIKDYLQEKYLIYSEVSCDDYLLHHREKFLSFIETKAGFPYHTFPMIFFDGRFIGGTSDTIRLLELCFEEYF